jgi:hypothetical protein
MAAVNLIRNSRVFFTTNLDSFGRVKIGALKDAASGMSTTNCFEIQVLEGMSFSQNTTVDTVTLNEAGAAPVRGQRSFNTALEPVDFSFSTYIRPHNTGTLITAEESLLWNAFGGASNIGAAGAAWTAGASTSTVAFTNSNKHQLLPFGLIILFDNAGYVIDNCALDSATIDFGIDAIAAVAWAGKGAAIRVLADAQANNASPVVFAGTDFDNTAPDQAAAKNTTARYITNKLSTLIVNDGINDFLLTGGVGNVYTIALTGGNITFSNNLTYLTPANLGTVNLPITYFTGTRAISGTINAYLKTGSLESGGLLSDLLAGSATTVDPKFTINVQMGGPSTNLTGVEIKLPAAMLQIPTINTEQVISTTINFTAQGYTGTGYDITQSNEATIVYRAAV